MGWLPARRTASMAFDIPVTDAVIVPMYGGHLPTSPAALRLLPLRGGLDFS